jgi:hypothetical protein
MYEYEHWPMAVAAVSIFIGLNPAASAQDDLERGKSGAQIFANDCALCHKTPQAVLKGGAPGEGFLRQHYTSSRESAASVAAYLRGIRAPVSAGGGSKSKSTARPQGKGAPKATGEHAKDKNKKEAKPADQKPAAAEAKPADTSSDVKASEPKPSDNKEQPESKKE